jgi:hypothetical protein
MVRRASVAPTPTRLRVLGELGVSVDAWDEEEADDDGDGGRRRGALPRARCGSAARPRTRVQTVILFRSDRTSRKVPAAHPTPDAANSGSPSTTMIPNDK